MRESELYAPLFGERALTNGAKNLSVTFNINRLRWKSINGSDVQNSSEGLLWGDTNYDNGGFGYVGVCRMDITTTSYSASGTYGLAERFDVSFAIPIIHTSVVGSNEFIDFSQDLGNGSISQVTTPGVGGRYYVDGSSTGFGDIGVGAKFANRATSGSGRGSRRPHDASDRFAGRHDRHRRVPHAVRVHRVDGKGRILPSRQHRIRGRYGGSLRRIHVQPAPASGSSRGESPWRRNSSDAASSV